MDLEGIVAKRKASAYRETTRWQYAERGRQELFKLRRQTRERLDDR
jgi:hypothetical protein